ncbi:helix-turn-helix domain-containing protein [Stenotrophomonas rhizophila]|uniref:helix-turn-helix domain-containing protein n=1 Tax=Stenotrophomonas rhizophila TaxID=216778 RepID=UPI00117F93CF|nr:helix-turn-helix domain-containing protein [Stenotrophomonas rhizophila]
MDLQIKGMTYAQIGEAIGCAGSTVGDLATGRSRSPRAASAIALLGLYSDRLSAGRAAPLTVANLGPLIDSRMTKRALRDRFGFKTDAHLAVVLKLPADQVASWTDEDTLPALPQVLELLGHQPGQMVAESEPTDPDAERVIQVQVA